MSLFTQLSVGLAWTLGGFVIALLPIDVATARLAPTPTPSVPAPTRDPTLNPTLDPSIDPATEATFIETLWTVSYFIALVLAWTLFPSQQYYVTSGHFTVWTRVVDAARGHIR